MKKTNHEIIEMVLKFLESIERRYGVRIDFNFTIEAEKKRRAPKKGKSRTGK